MQLPPRYDHSLYIVYLLHKDLYGLKQAESDLFAKFSSIIS